MTDRLLVTESTSRKKTFSSISYYLFSTHRLMLIFFWPCRSTNRRLHVRSFYPWSLFFRRSSGAFSLFFVSFFSEVTSRSIYILFFLLDNCRMSRSSATEQFFFLRNMDNRRRKSDYRGKKNEEKPIVDEDIDTRTLLWICCLVFRINITEQMRIISI